MTQDLYLGNLGGRGRQNCGWRGSQLGLILVILPSHPVNGETHPSFLVSCSCCPLIRLHQVRTCLKMGIGNANPSPHRDSPPQKKINYHPFQQCGQIFVWCLFVGCLLCSTTKTSESLPEIQLGSNISGNGGRLGLKKGRLGICLLSILLLLSYIKCR